MRAFLWFFGLMVLAILGMGLLTYPAWLLLHPHFDFPFHRIGARIGMLVLLAGFLLVARRLGVSDRASLGYGLPRRLFLRELLVGLALGVATMLAVVALMSALGLLDWRRASALTGTALAKLLVMRLLSGLAVALIEESFLRGAMFSAIARESGTRAAVILTAVVYSATHFFASYHIAPAQVSAHSGIDLLAGTLQAFARPLLILDAFLALFAVGVVLALVRSATGNIAACLGLHAGWVWVILVVHELTQPLRGAPLGFLLSRFDGFVGWLVFGWTVLLAVPLWRFYRGRAVSAVT
ncbi:MAG: CPBP family intramembrane metalloprotease [Proteobacteria bacterium]|nr:CPBP family intramembrane metalloprotease [Pseudomonadota bacterium]